MSLINLKKHKGYYIYEKDIISTQIRTSNMWKTHKGSIYSNSDVSLENWI